MTIQEIKGQIKDIDEGLAEFSESEKKEYGSQLLAKRKELESELKKLESATKEVKKVEPKTPKKSGYKLGDMYSSDFDYDGMLEMGKKVNTTWSKKDLQKLFDSFEDVNYHTVAAPLHAAIHKSKDKKEEAENIAKFNKLVREELGEKIVEKKEVAKIKVTKEKIVSKAKAKTSKVVSEAKELLEKLRATKAQKAFNAGKTKEELERDLKREALPIGKRISAEGNTYYEYRSNRADVSTKRKPYLEDGGEIENDFPPVIFNIESKEQGKEIHKKVLDLVGGKNFSIQQKGDRDYYFANDEESFFKLTELYDKTYKQDNYPIKVGEMVKVKKYGWVMRVDKIEDDLFFLENDKRGTRNGNAGSYSKYELEKVYAEGGEIEDEQSFHKGDKVKKKTTGEKAEVLNLNKGGNSLMESYSVITEDGKHCYWWATDMEVCYECGGRMMERGGYIKNQYQGKTAEQVWNEWTIAQRSHFLLDHVGRTKVESNRDKSFDELSESIKLDLEFHVTEGQYAKGGVAYNTGRSWHQDRAMHNKAESWEKPLSKRKMEEGGEIEDSNNEMLQSQLKAVKHHAEELSNIINDNTPIEAWVVGKIERAATDLSDITHYLDGQKFEMGSEMKWGGRVTFKEKVEAITESLNGRKVKPKYKKEYGNTYDKKEAKQAATKIVGALVKKEKMEKGGEMSSISMTKKVKDYLKEKGIDKNTIVKYSKVKGLLVIDNLPTFYSADEIAREVTPYYWEYVSKSTAKLGEHEMKEKGGKVSRSQKKYNKEVDAYKYFIVDLKNKKAISGWEFRDDAKEALSDYDGDKNYKVVAQVTLKSLGIENPKEEFKKS